MGLGCISKAQLLDHHKFCYKSGFTFSYACELSAVFFKIRCCTALTRT